MQSLLHIHDFCPLSNVEQWVAKALLNAQIQNLITSGKLNRFAFKLALYEALNNAVIHGNLNNPLKKVTLDIVLDETRLEIRVSDEGKGFKLPSVVPHASAESVSGRGFELLEAYGFNPSVEEKTLILKFYLNSSNTPLIFPQTPLY